MKGKRIPREHFVHLAPHNIDEQVNVNHNGCSAGLDTKRRLYIKRSRKNGRDIILAYCHHCGCSGVVMERPQKIKRAVRTECVPATSNVRDVSMPYDVTRDEGCWPLLGRRWVRQADLTDEEIKRYGLCYSELYDRIIIPIYNDGQKLSGWIGRRLAGDGPKYIYKGKAELKYYMVITKPDSSSVCIVEDILSCIRVGRYMNATALCGTTINDKLLVKLSKYSSVLIYLDDDNQDVRSKQRVLKNKLDLLVDSVTIIHSNGIDPKELSDSSLKELLLKHT